jgi:4-amino-4-deoxy-L-arabinose transferase-like glycosyltransferase
MSALRSPSGERAAPPAPLIGLLVLILAVRLVLASLLPLTEDEAYYRLWARSPAFGYFDHPPMIAWWIWLGQRLAGDTPLAVRLLPSLASGLTSLVIYDLALRLDAGAATAGRALVWYNATLLVAAGGFLAVPDAPAAMFWTLTLWAASRVGNPGAMLWWIIVGLAAGAASLSKYSSLFLAPGVFLWLAVDRRRRGWLAGPGPWLALLIGAALFSLNVAWNAQHDWTTFAKQFGRAAPHGFAPRHLAELIVEQALLLNPLIAVFLARGLGREGRTSSLQAGLLWASSAPFALYLAFHSLHATVQAHWPAPLYPALALIAAGAAADPAIGPRLKTLRSATPFLGFGLVALMLAYLALPLVGIPLRFDPAAPLRGWAPFSARLEAVRQASGAAWVATTSYGLAAQLMSEPAIRAPVLQVSERERWRGLYLRPPNLARPGLLVDLNRRVSMPKLRACFSSAMPLGVLERGAPGESGKAYTLILVSGPRRDLLKDGC